MTGIQVFGYEGKRVLVVGGATGTGAAVARGAARLGAEVAVLDRVPADLAGLDAAIDQVGRPVDAVFAGSGAVDRGPGTVKISFIAHRHLIERMIDEGTLGPGSAACLISTASGLGWKDDEERLADFLAAPDYTAADKWITGHAGTDADVFREQAIHAYVTSTAGPLMAKGIRINAICPGPPGARPVVPERFCTAALFLNSDSAAAKGISGVNVLVDDGLIMSAIGGSWEPGGPVIKFLMTGTSH
jgi:NAD(P)-dependent dehydrogenase (short-subunit alcohol dehydrogenase family)